MSSDFADHVPNLREELPWALAVASAAWLLYIATAPHSVVLEDDGLFILSAWFLGIEHPPGYPLYVLLGKLAALFPLGSPAWRLHAMSGLFGALACGVAYLLGRTVIRDRAGALLAASGLAVSSAFWSQAVIADVYTLHALIFFLVLLLALRLSKNGADLKKRTPEWNALALTVGLGLANHWPLLLLSLPGIAVILWPVRRQFLRRAPVLALWLVVGLLPYLWMVWRSHMGPLISFQGPIDSWQEFVDYLLRRGYAGVDHSDTASWQDRLRYGGFLVQEAFWQFSPLGATLALVGFHAQWGAPEKRLAWGMSLAFIGPTLLLVFLLSFDYDPLKREAFRVYPIPAWGIMALWLGAGMTAVLAKLKRERRAAAAGLIIALVVGWSSLLHAPRNNRSADWLPQAYAQAVLQALEPNALLLVAGDLQIPQLAYLHLIERVRPDVQLISRQGLILEPKLFDPYASTVSEQQSALDAYLVATERPIYAMFEHHQTSGQVSLLLYRPPESLRQSGTVSYVLEGSERLLMQRVLAHGPMADGWSEFLRRFLLERFALFHALAEQAGQWPEGDDELDGLLAQALRLPEAALARAGRRNAAQGPEIELVRHNRFLSFEKCRIQIHQFATACTL